MAYSCHNKNSKKKYELYINKKSTFYPYYEDTAKLDKWMYLILNRLKVKL